LGDKAGRDLGRLITECGLNYIHITSTLLVAKAGNKASWIPQSIDNGSIGIYTMKLQKKKSKEDNRERDAIKLGSTAGKKTKWAESEV
jgi:hypothetical protein